MVAPEGWGFEGVPSRKIADEGGHLVSSKNASRENLIGRSARTSLRLAALVLIAACGLLAAGGAAAQADTGSGVGITEFTCTHVVFTYEGFANAEGNTVAEVVTLNREIVATYTFTFNGPTGTNSVPIPEIPGKSIVDAHATWKTNGVNGGFDHHKNVHCQDGFSVEKLQEIKGSETGYTASELHGKIGQTVDYEVLVKNVGLVPLKFSNFTDEHCDPGTIMGGSGEAFLAPGESTTFTCERLLTAIGTYTNEATVTGTPEMGPPSTETSKQVVTVVPIEPEFSIHKLQRVNGEGEFTAAQLEAGVGAEVEYEILVTNTGNEPLTFSEFADPKCDPGTIAGGPGVAMLLPGESTTYTCDHVMVKKDTRKGPYINTASVTGTPPPGDGKPVSHTSNPVEVVILEGSGTTEFGCKAVTFVYSGFPNAEGNEVTQVIAVTGPKAAGVIISTTVFVFNGPSGMDTVPIELGPGKWIIDAHATWKTNGASGAFDHHIRVICGEEKG
jgi:hypothetical protein